MCADAPIGTNRVHDATTGLAICVSSLTREAISRVGITGPIMRLRFKDFRCSQCMDEVHDVLEIDGDITIPKCCRSSMVPIPGGPTVHFKPHYSHALGKKVNRYIDEERALEKKGEWIASKTEANRLYDTADFSDSVVIKKAQKETIKKHVEKAAARAVADGVVRFND